MPTVEEGFAAIDAANADDPHGKELDHAERAVGWVRRLRPDASDALLLAAPVMGMAPTSTGRGYLLASADGGVFAFGDATYRGGAVGQVRSPVTGIAAAPGGYWLVTADGGVYAYGLAAFHGRARHHRPIVGITAHPDGGGYWLVASDGAVFAFGRARWHGSSPLAG